MNSLHSVLGSLATTGTLYGWRIDAMLLSGFLWVAVASYGRLRDGLAPRPQFVRV